MAMKLVDVSEVIEEKKDIKREEKKDVKREEKKDVKREEKKDVKREEKKIEILDPSKVVGGKKENCGCYVVPSGKPLSIISADKIIVCERVGLGIPNSCALCQGVSKEMFHRCKNKWAD